MAVHLVGAARRSNHSRMRLRRASILGALAVLLLAACSGGGSEPVSSDSANGGGADATSSQTPSATVAAAPLLPGVIVFRRYADTSETDGSLYAISSDGSNEQQLTQPLTSTVDDEPSWSPDGTRLVFTRRTKVGTHSEQMRLFTVSADGSKLTQVSPAHDTGADAVISGDNAAAFSPDGKLIAFGNYHGRETDGEIQFSNIMVMNADGTQRRQITDSSAYSGDDGGVAWSPDGTQLVYARSNAGTFAPIGGRALFIINVDGSHEHRLTPWSLGAGGTPDWSAATNQIVFRAVDDEESGIGNFYTIRPDGTGLNKITHFTNTVISHKVGFSPDGKWIVFAKEATNGVNDIFIARASGAHVSAVTNTPLADSAPTWGPR